MCQGRQSTLASERRWRERPERLLRLSSPVSVAASRARPIRPCAIRACSTSSRYPFADLHHEVDAKALALGPTNERPDVLIDRDGMTAALRSDSGNLVFSPATAAGYSVDNWLLADGDNRAAE